MNDHAQCLKSWVVVPRKVDPPWLSIEQRPGEKAVELLERKIDAMNAWHRKHQLEVDALTDRCRRIAMDEEQCSATAFQRGMEALYEKYPTC